MEEQFDFYPKKPTLPKKENKSGWSMTLLSLVLFVASFMILFSDRIQFLVFLIVVLFIHEMGHFLFMKLFHYARFCNGVIVCCRILFTTLVIDVAHTFKPLSPNVLLP